MRSQKSLVVICLASFVAAAFLLPSDPWARYEPLRAIAILLVAVPAYYLGVRRGRDAPGGEPSVPARRRRYLQFSMRTLLVLTTFAALYLGLYCDRARRQKASVENLQNLENCSADYDCDLDIAAAQTGRAPGGMGGIGLAFTKRDSFAVQIAGKDFCHRVVAVHLGLREIERAMPDLKRLPYLEDVYVGDYGEEAQEVPDDVDLSKAEQAARRRLESSIETLKQNLPSVHVQKEPQPWFVWSGIPPVG